MHSIRQIYALPGDVVYLPPGSIGVEKAIGSVFTVKVHTCDWAESDLVSCECVRVV